MSYELLVNILGTLILPIVIVIFGEFRVWKIYNSEKYNYEKELYEIRYVKRDLQEEDYIEQQIEFFGDFPHSNVTYISKFDKNNCVYFCTYEDGPPIEIIRGEIFYKELISRKLFKTLFSYKKLKYFENKEYVEIVDKKCNMICTIIVDNTLKLRLRNVVIEKHV